MGLPFKHCLRLPSAASEMNSGNIEATENSQQ